MAFFESFESYIFFTFLLCYFISSEASLINKDEPTHIFLLNFFFFEVTLLYLKKN